MTARPLNNCKTNLKRWNGVVRERKPFQVWKLIKARQFAYSKITQCHTCHLNVYKWYYLQRMPLLTRNSTYTRCPDTDWHGRLGCIYWLYIILMYLLSYREKRKWRRWLSSCMGPLKQGGQGKVGSSHHSCCLRSLLWCNFDVIELSQRTQMTQGMYSEIWHLPIKNNYTLHWVTTKNMSLPCTMDYCEHPM